MVDSGDARHGIEELRGEVGRLRELLRRMESERNAVARQRRRRLLTIGLVISLAAHLTLILYFSTLHRFAPGGGISPVGYEFAIVSQEQLQEMMDTTALDEMSLDEPAVEELSEPMVTLDASSPPAELAPGGAAGLAGLAGAGDALDGEGGLSGAGTTYFGIAGRGTRFAYIVDRSGSMSAYNRMGIALRELARSIQGLPDYAQFHVVFFSSPPVVTPPMQRGWLRARPNTVTNFTRWLDNVTPGGGTVPRPAFEHVFALDVRPDVIFFMTDGIIAGFSAEEVRQMNSRGRRVVIHTITFGDQGSEELMRQIARDSGGTYRFVPDGGM
jgi:hypothetical protein